MSVDPEVSNSRIPSLVQLCQRGYTVVANHADSLWSLGDNMRYDLLRPVLENCSPDTLLRLEHSSPWLEKDTAKLWERLSYRSYPIDAQQYSSTTVEESRLWREAFFLFREREAERFEQLGTRLRTIRQEEAERKKESQIKITDKPPPSKRSRSWGQSQPKTLLQKTLSDAARLQKGIYGKRMIPPMLAAKTWRVPSAATGARPVRLASSSSASVSTTSSTTSRTAGSRVTVTSVPVRRPPSGPIVKPMPPPKALLPPSTPSGIGTTITLQDTESPAPSTLSVDVSSPTKRSSSLSKKDPLSNLFMPKRRAHSQLPTHAMSRPMSSRG